MNIFSNLTYYIRCDNLELIEQALTRMFELEGCHRILLPTLTVDIEELRCNRWPLGKELWVFGLFVGGFGWTVVKISPAELLCRRAIGGNRPRLSELAIHIGCDAFYVGYNGGAILMETDAKGGVFISGSVDKSNTKEDQFFEEKVNLVDKIPSIEELRLMSSKVPKRFFLLNVSEEIHSSEQKLEEEKSRIVKQWEEQFLNDYAKRYFSLMKPNKLEQWKVRFRENRTQLFNEKGGNQLWKAWSASSQDWNYMPSGFSLFERAIGQLLGGTPSYWQGGEPLIYRAYTQQEQLAADGARLFLVQPAEHYR